MKSLKAVFLFCLLFYAFPAFSFKLTNTCTFISDTTVDSLVNNAADTAGADTVIRLKERPLKSPVKYSARDSIRFDITMKQVYLYGAAEVTYEKIRLKADYIRIDQANFTLYAEGLPDSTGKIRGTPVFEDDGQVYQSDYISYNFKTKKGKIRQVTTSEGEGFLIGEEVKKNEQDEFFVKNGKYTTCNLPDPHFYIAITKAKKQENKIISGPAYLVVEDVPLPLAVPFGFFPARNNRSSGILFPEIGEDQSLGFFLRNGGYYFGLNDYIDVALRGTIFSKGSFGMDVQNRYNVRYKYNGNFSVKYSERKFGEPETPAFEKQKDFFVTWIHTQDSKARPGSRFNASVKAGSSSYLRNNSYNFRDVTNNNLHSTISYNKSWAGTPFNLDASLGHSQNTQTRDVYVALPKVAFNMSRINPLDSKKRVGSPRWYQQIGVRYTLEASNEINSPDSLLFERSALDRFNNGIRHTIPVSTSFSILKHVTVTPSVNYSERWYFRSIRKAAIGQTIIVDTIQGFETAREYSTSANMQTRVYGMYNINRWGIVALRHVLNPSMSFTYRPDFGKPSLGYYRTLEVDTGIFQTYSIFEGSVYGTPQRNESGVIGFGVGNNLEMKVRTKNDTADVIKKVKLLESLSISGSYNLMADSLNFSRFVVNARTTLFEKVGVDLNGNFDPYIQVEDSLGRVFTLDRFELNENGRLARLTNASVSLNTNLNAEAFKRRPAAPAGYTQDELDYINRNYVAFVDFNIPWQLNMSFNINYSRPSNVSVITKSLNFNGDVNVTKKWKIGFDSGYDFELEKPTFTSLNIYRDLHCWDLAIRWIPFGSYQSYSVDLKVKASVLQDLKLSRRREYYER